MSGWGNFTIDPTVVRHVGRPYREEVRIAPGIPDGALGVDHEEFFLTANDARRRLIHPDDYPPRRHVVSVSRAIIARAFLAGCLTGFVVTALVVAAALLLH